MFCGPAHNALIRRGKAALQLLGLDYSLICVDNQCEVLTGSQQIPGNYHCHEVVPYSCNDSPGKISEIRAQLTEQMKCLDQQCELRVQLLQDLQDFFRKKAEIEMDYSRNLEKLAERFLAKTRSTKDQQFKKDQNVLSPVNCWNLLLNQVKRESRDHTTLSDIYLNNIIPRFVQVSEDSGRLFKKCEKRTELQPLAVRGLTQEGVFPVSQRQEAVEVLDVNIGLFSYLVLGRQLGVGLKRAAYFSPQGQNL
ncbi:SLIT-ROBO Rho GTPase-activating protein 2 [Fukomys damarensis]|uniref:SLIT-ROBO Rho GTPase-activating protein 2 n=1 Tax=Fukomys damarensis TaxID=885580 RepID=A0A091CNP2_FUKDA|nr:SLIT-ROBO Rho GTPase-activating protein 2 [Fukomys damarensis]